MLEATTLYVMVSESGGYIQPMTTVMHFDKKCFKLLGGATKSPNDKVFVSYNAVLTTSVLAADKTVLWFYHTQHILFHRTFN